MYNNIILYKNLDVLGCPWPLGWESLRLDSVMEKILPKAFKTFNTRKNGQYLRHRFEYIVG